MRRTVAAVLGALVLAGAAMAGEDSHEEDDTPAAADVKGYFAEATDFSGEALDDDYFLISVQAGYQQLDIALTFTHASGDLDLRLYDSDGTTELSASASISNNESISYEVAAAGEYYLRVEPVGTLGNLYVLDRVSSAPDVPGDDDDDGGGCSPSAATGGAAAALALLAGGAVALMRRRVNA